MIVYLDTSSLVKLYVEEEGADEVRALAAEAQVVATSLVAYPELRAAMARRRREGALLPADYREARRAVDDDWARYLVVAVTRELARKQGTWRNGTGCAASTACTWRRSPRSHEALGRLT